MRVVYVGASVLLILVSAWLLSYPAGLPGDLEPIFVGPLLFLIWAGVAAWWLFRLVGVVVRRVRRRPQTARLSALLGGAAVLGLGLVIVWGAAFRVRFELSKAALERVAKEPTTRTWSVGPGRTGLYHVQNVAIVGPWGTKVLITNSCALADCGFAYSPSGPPPRVCRDSDYQEYTHISGPWYSAYLSPAGPCG